MASANFIRLIPEGTQCPTGAGNFSIGIGKSLSAPMTGFLLSAKCTKNPGDLTERTVTFKLDHSPDGVNWTQVKMSDGSLVTYQCQTNVPCATKAIDTPLLPYVRGHCGETGVVASEGLPTCTFDIYYTTFK
tara:strand:- start:2359 stop:2754 length:396 start_codon:yes stop_codon:yes gene_type:complete